MSAADFINTFKQYKERYLQQDPALGNKRAMEHFEKWLKGNYHLLHMKARPVKYNKIEVGQFLENIVLVAKRRLAGKGVQINCISLGLKESSKCLSVFSDNSVYYRLARTCPRLGPYGGMELLVMELVMDGNKNNIFIPLLGRLGTLEKSLGSKIERENARAEATGKYRFKLIFPFNPSEPENKVKSLGEILAQFIYLTRDELLKLNIS